VRSTHHGKPTQHLPAPTLASTHQTSTHQTSTTKPINQHPPNKHCSTTAAPTKQALLHPPNQPTTAAPANQHCTGRPWCHSTSTPSTHLQPKGERRPPHQEGQAVAQHRIARGVGGASRRQLAFQELCKEGKEEGMEGLG
jgi:hypothetical protein